VGGGGVRNADEPTSSNKIWLKLPQQSEYKRAYLNEEEAETGITHVVEQDPQPASVVADGHPGK